MVNDLVNFTDGGQYRFIVQFYQNCLGYFALPKEDKG